NCEVCSSISRTSWNALARVSRRPALPTGTNFTVEASSKQYPEAPRLIFCVTSFTIGTMKILYEYCETFEQLSPSVGCCCLWYLLFLKVMILQSPRVSISL